MPKQDAILSHKYFYHFLILIVALVLVNQIITLKVYSTLIPRNVQTVDLKNLNIKIDGKTAVGPVLLSEGEKPVISGYRTRIKSMPSISELQLKPSTGDSVQDMINNLIPTGTPFYGEEAKVSFDDPLESLQTWSNHERSIKLTDEEQQRWNKIVNSFTCDYCCGSPSNPTIITRCGCAHAASWRGIAKWFIKYHPEYSDAEIFGEMTRWKTLFYPGPTIQRISVESQNIVGA
ncbi:MAG: hypothetical protein J4428_01830 [Candidatus Aenigmarchaeota archaeon]|nr:hypothetical protein [Candidatus Aenigmarchaeota archaeon]